MQAGIYKFYKTGYLPRTWTVVDPDGRELLMSFAELEAFVDNMQPEWDEFDQNGVLVDSRRHR